MYHGFCVSCSSLPPPHTHTHLSTGMDLKKNTTQWWLALLCSCLVSKQTSLETFPSESFIRPMTSEHRFGWKKCLSRVQIGTLPRTPIHQGMLYSSSSSFYLCAYSSMLQLSLILVHQSCTNMTNKQLRLSRWTELEVTSVVLNDASCL